MKWLAIMVAAMPAVAWADASGVKVADGFAQCIVGFMPKQSLALLDTAPASKEEQVLLAKFGKVSGCMGVLRGKLRMSGPFMRGAIANALYRRDFGKTRPSEVVTIDVPRATGVADLLAHDLARCLAARLPGAAHDFVVAKAGSDDAVRYFRPIAAEFSTCAPESGGLRTTHTLLRARVAEAIYDLRTSATQTADTQ